MASRTVRRSRSRGCRPTSARPRKVPGRYRRSRRRPDPGRVRYSWHRGQARRDPFRPHHKIPLLGLCLGLQAVVIEAARSVGLEDANSEEFDPDTKHPVISTMADQEQIVAVRPIWVARCVSARTRPCWRRAPSSPRRTAARTSPSATVTATRSTKRVPEPDRQERPRVLGHLARRSPRRVRRAARGQAPVLRCHAGTSGLKSRPTRPHPLFSGSSARLSTTRAAEQLPVEVTDVSASSPADAAEAATADSVG